MAKPRLIDVLDTLGFAIQNAINAANIPAGGGNIAPGETVLGWAVTTELVKILARGGMNHLVVLWPLKAKIEPYYAPTDPSSFTVTPPATPTLTQSIVGNVLTFGGSVTGAYNVHLLVNGIGDALVQTTNAEAVSAVASAMATAINGLGLPGVSAVASGNAVTMTGVFYPVCRIGGAGSITTEVMRVTRLVQASLYAPSAPARNLIDDAIVQGVGNVTNFRFVLSDGQGMEARYCDGGEYREKAQSSYSAFESHNFFRVEYPIVAVTPATQIEAVKTTDSVGAMPSQTAYS